MGESRSIRNDILISLFTLPLYFVASGRYGLKILVLLGISVLVGFTAEKVSALLRKDNNTVYALPFWFLFPPCHASGVSNPCFNPLPALCIDCMSLLFRRPWKEYGIPGCNSLGICRIKLSCTL